MSEHNVEINMDRKFEIFLSQSQLLLTSWLISKTTSSISIITITTTASIITIIISDIIIMIITIGVGDVMVPTNLIHEKHEDKAKHERYSDPPYGLRAWHAVVMMVIVMVTIDRWITAGHQWALFQIFVRVLRYLNKIITFLLQ